jgi:hypothetical protein
MLSGAAAHCTAKRPPGSSTGYCSGQGNPPAGQAGAKSPPIRPRMLAVHRTARRRRPPIPARPLPEHVQPHPESRHKMAALKPIFAAAVANWQVPERSTRRTKGTTPTFAGTHRTGRSACACLGFETAYPAIPIWRSVIVRANHNAPACHATRPRGACCGPLWLRSIPGRQSRHGLTAKCAPQAVPCLTVENSVLRSGHRRQAPWFHWRAQVHGEEELDHYLRETPRSSRPASGLHVLLPVSR